MTFINKVFSSVFDYLELILGVLVNLLLVPLTLLYTALTTKVNLGKFSITPAGAVYYVWYSYPEHRLKCSDAVAGGILRGIKLLKTNPLAAAYIMAILCLPAIIGGVIMLIGNLFKGTKHVAEDVDTPEILDDPTPRRSGGRKAGRKKRTVSNN